MQNPFTPVMRLNIHGHGPGNNVTTIVSRSNFSVGVNLTYNFGQMKQNVSKARHTIVNDDLSTGSNNTNGQGGGITESVK